jgi:hypothetical protein
MLGVQKSVSVEHVKTPFDIISYALFSYKYN